MADSMPHYTATCTLILATNPGQAASSLLVPLADEQRLAGDVLHACARAAATAAAAC